MRLDSGIKKIKGTKTYVIAGSPRLLSVMKDQVAILNALYEEVNRTRASISEDDAIDVLTFISGMMWNPMHRRSFDLLDKVLAGNADPDNLNEIAWCRTATLFPEYVSKLVQNYRAMQSEGLL